jgi:hypothetical protein
MRIYVFVSHVDPALRGFTVDAAGRNLPAQYRPWHVTNHGRAFRVGNRLAPITDVVRRDGYLLMDTDPYAVHHADLLPTANQSAGEDLPS